MKKSSKKWINAAILLLENPQADVLCPECGKGLLKLNEVVKNDNVDIYLICPVCKSSNVITRKKHNSK